MTVTKQDVLKALTELRANRPRLAADRMIRGYLQRFGNGATTITELDPAYYDAVFAAVGGSVDAQDFYGVTLDVQPVVVSSQTEQSRLRSQTAQSKPASTRTRTPMTIQLEALLAARAGMPRSKPTLHVDIGAPAHQGDEDTIPEYPSDGRRMQ